MSDRKKIVILVDNKRRDLRAVALIAWHLEQLGCQPILEPLEAWRAVLAADRPDVIVFNHLTTTTLAAYSARLRDLGVKVAVLPNESLLYDRDTLDFNCRKRVESVHIDLFFCWSGMVKAALLRNGFGSPTRIEVVGNPKFDFYCEPWNRLYRRLDRPAGQRPQVLICTNFALAGYAELPRIEADKLFALWSQQVPLYKDYWAAIQANHRSRARALKFFEALLADDRYDVTLRPHPGERPAFYTDWIAGLPAPQQQRLRLAVDDPIHGLILNCDLEISCETCTTALESWIAGKPTIELVFEKHPMFYHPEVARLNVECDQPAELPALVARQLAAPEQAEYQAGRRAHLEKWCHSPNGTTCEQIARALAELAQTACPQWNGNLGFSDYRRSLKLKLARAAGVPCNFDLFLGLKAGLFPHKYREKRRTSEKTIRPADVAVARAEIARCANTKPNP